MAWTGGGQWNNCPSACVDGEGSWGQEGVGRCLCQAESPCGCRQSCHSAFLGCAHTADSSSRLLPIFLHTLDSALGNLRMRDTLEERAEPPRQLASFCTSLMGRKGLRAAPKTGVALETGQGKRCQSPFRAADVDIHIYPNKLGIASKRKCTSSTSFCCCLFSVIVG